MVFASEPSSKRFRSILVLDPVPEIHPLFSPEPETFFVDVRDPHRCPNRSSVLVDGIWTLEYVDFLRNVPDGFRRY